MLYRLVAGRNAKHSDVSDLPIDESVNLCQSKLGMQAFDVLP